MRGDLEHAVLHLDLADEQRVLQVRQILEQVALIGELAE